jgi:hypothetical protein
MKEVMIMNGKIRFQRRVGPLVTILVGVIFSIAFPAQSNATLACCTIPPPPPCDTHPEMCA